MTVAEFEKNLGYLTSFCGIIFCKSLLDEQLSLNADVIVKAFEAFGTFDETKTSAEVAKITDLCSKISVNFCPFVQNVAKTLGVNVTSSYSLVREYLACEFTGSQKEMERVLSSSQDRSILLDLIEQYYFERILASLKCRRIILQHFQDLDHPFQHELARFVEVNFTNEESAHCLFRQLETITLHGAWPTAVNKLRSSSERRSSGYNWLTIQISLIQALIWQFKVLEYTAAEIMMLFNFFKKSHFGERQSIKASNADEECLVNTIGHLELLLILQCFDIDWLLVQHTEESTMDVREHCLVRNGNAMTELHDAVMSLCPSHEHSALFLVYRMFLFFVAKDADGVSEEVASTRNVTVAMDLQKLGLWARKHGAVALLRSLLQDPIMKIDKELQRLAATTIYGIINSALCFYEAHSLANENDICSLLVELLHHANIADDFWDKNFSIGVSQFYRTVLHKFPFSFMDVISLSTALASASVESSRKIVTLFQRLPCFTEQLSDSILDELQPSTSFAGEEGVFELAHSRIASACDWIMPAGTTCEIFGTDTDDDDACSPNGYVQWRFLFNGWQVCLKMVCEGFCTLEADEKSNAVVKLISTLIEREPALAENFVHFLDAFVVKLCRLAQEEYPNCESVSLIVDALSATCRLNAKEVLLQLTAKELLPVIASCAELATTKIDGRFFGRLLLDVECLEEKFSVTIAFLKLVKTLAESLRDSSHPAFIGCAMFVLKDVFVVYEKWQYCRLEDKYRIGRQCMEIINSLFRMHSLEEKADATSKAAIMSATIAVLCSGEGRRSLLSVACVGVECLRFHLRSDVSSDDLYVSVALSLSILSRLLDFTASDPASLASTSRSPLIPFWFDGGFPGASPFAVFANYVFLRNNTRVPKLSLICLTKIAQKYPSILMSYLGDAAESFCEAFTERLIADAEDVHFKVVCFGFLTACVDTQSALTEMLLGIRAQTLRQFETRPNSCLIATWSTLQKVFETNGSSDESTATVSLDLLSAAVKFLCKLWTVRHAIACDWFRAQPKFWSIIAGVWTLLCRNEVDLSSSVECISTLAALLRILTVEVYYKNNCAANSHTGEAEKDLTELMEMAFSSASIDYICRSLSLYCSMSMETQRQLNAVEVDQTLFMLPLAWKEFLVVVSRKSKSFGSQLAPLWPLLERRSFALLHQMLLSLSQPIDVDENSKWVKNQRRNLVTICSTALIALQNYSSFSESHEWLADVQKICELLRLVVYGFESVSARLVSILLGCANIVVGKYKANAGPRFSGPDLTAFADSLCSLIKKLASVYVDLAANVLLPKDASAKWLDALLSCLATLQTLAKSGKASISESAAKSFESSLAAVLRRDSVLRSLAALLQSFSENWDRKRAKVATTYLAVLADLHCVIRGSLKASELFQFVTLEFSSMITQFSALGAADQYVRQLCLFYLALIRDSTHDWVSECATFVSTNVEELTKMLKQNIESLNVSALSAAEAIALLLLKLLEHRSLWLSQFPDLQALCSVEVQQCCHNLIMILSKPNLLQRKAQLLCQKRGGRTLDVLAFALESVDALPISEDAKALAISCQRSLLKLLLCLLRVLHLLAWNMQSLWNELTIDVNSVEPVVALQFAGSTAEHSFTFTSLFTCIECCLTLLRKTDSSRSSFGSASASPSKQHPLAAFASGLTVSDRTVICNVLEIAIFLILNQATLYLLRSGVDARQRQMLQRDIESELQPLLVRLSRKPGTGSPSTPRKSPVSFQLAVETLNQDFLKSMFDLAENVLSFST